MTRYEPFLIALFVLVFALLFQRQMRASYSAIILGWFGTFFVFVILALPKLLPLLEVLKANTVELRVISPSGIWPKWFLQSILYSPEVMHLIPQFIADHTKLLAVTMSPKHVIGIKITASVLVLLAGILNLRHSIRLWILLTLAFLLACGPYAPLPIWRLLFLFPVFDTMNDFTKYWNVFALFAVCGLAALGFDATTQLFQRAFTSPGQRIVVKIVLGGIFFAAILHPFVYSFGINWQLYQFPPTEVTARQFYQVASASWDGVPSHGRWGRGPERGVEDTVMYFNLQKNIGTITWYGSVVLPEKAAAKFLINKNGTARKNANYKGEVYCATVQNSECDIQQLVISYNRLTVSTGQNFTEPSEIVLNFNYDPRWSTNHGAIVNHSGLLAVKLPGRNNQNRSIVLNYSDPMFLAGLAFFLAGVVVWPMWYFGYYALTEGCTYWKPIGIN
jgi:hypothetical protein